MRSPTVLLPAWISADQPDHSHTHSKHVQINVTSSPIQHQQLHTSHLPSQPLVGGSTTHCPTPLCSHTSRSRSRCRHQQHCRNGNISRHTHNCQQQQQAAATALQGQLQGRSVRRASGHKAAHGTVAKRCLATQWASSVHQLSGPGHMWHVCSGNQVSSIAWVCCSTLTQLSADTRTINPPLCHGLLCVPRRGSVSPAAWTAAERLRLNFPPHKAPNNQRLRLACQVSRCVVC